MSMSMNNANVISSLFSNFQGGMSSQGSSFQTDMLGINYTDYASIRSGSYQKLLKAYYSNEDIQKSDSDTSSTKDKQASAAKIQTDASALQDSAEALLDQGSKSLFKKVTTTDKEGNKTEGYDTDKIYKAVDEFVKNYNAAVKSAGSSSANGVTTAAASMVNMTNINSKMLKDIGITVNSKDHTIALDEKSFKSADMTKVKSLLNDKGSFAYRVSVQSSMIEYHAKNEAQKANTYNGFGKYSNNFSSGNMWDNWI